MINIADKTFTVSGLSKTVQCIFHKS